MQRSTLGPPPRALRVLTALAALGLLAACGGDGDSTPDAQTGPSCVDNGARAEGSAINPEHGHTLTIQPADVEAALQKDYNIQGESLHSHFITLTGDHFATLAENNPVTVVSTTDSGHSHQVTLSCVSF